jgi:hypothetical protein
MVLRSFSHLRIVRSGTLFLDATYDFGLSRDLLSNVLKYLVLLILLATILPLCCSGVRSRAMQRVVGAIIND